MISKRQIGDVVRIGSTSKQETDNQRRELNAVAERSGWSAVPRERWPDNQEWRESMKPYFDRTWGDRRQEKATETGLISRHQFPKPIPPQTHPVDTPAHKARR
jgi:hypothetical protein